MDNLELVPCKGAFHEIIQPGDFIGYMTVCAHQPALHKGVYNGMRNGCASVTEHYFKSTFHDPDTGADITDWNATSAWIKEKIGESPKYPDYWQREQNPNFENERAKYDQYRAAFAAVTMSRVEKFHPATRNRSLRNNVMFKLEK